LGRLQNCFVLKPYHREPNGLQKFLPECIFFRGVIVDRAIPLHNQAGTGAVKIHNETVDHMLTAELGVAELAVAQALPQHLLRRGWLMALLACQRLDFRPKGGRSFGRIADRFISHGIYLTLEDTSPPTPSPSYGEGERQPSGWQGVRSRAHERQPSGGQGGEVTTPPRTYSPSAPPRL